MDRVSLATGSPKSLLNCMKVDFSDFQLNNYVRNHYIKVHCTMPSPALLPYDGTFLLRAHVSNSCLKSFMVLIEATGT